MTIDYFCDPDWIRTNGLLLRRQLLYPAELPDRIIKNRKTNFFLACSQSE